MYMRRTSPREGSGQSRSASAPLPTGQALTVLNTDPSDNDETPPD
ncbi:hypothetical protein N802_09580 [Knoellia sinensis KCTC 19936]|uniref:Uncharacterized protein n=1 Tax=Knoellia sinensis KCTC 19936 TaxID=1385520 RepID=A0A0A0J263_9MICO|nr:hypothetical protein N802_09580 [Knoellia sinensis KCTC 19936]